MRAKPPHRRVSMQQRRDEPPRLEDLGAWREAGRNLGKILVRPPLGAGPSPGSGRSNGHCSARHGPPCFRRRRSTACGPSTTRRCVPRWRRPDATQRCLDPGFSERIGNSRRTGSPSIRHVGEVAARPETVLGDAIRTPEGCPAAGGAPDRRSSLKASAPPSSRPGESWLSSAWVYDHDPRKRNAFVRPVVPASTPDRYVRRSLAS